MMAPGCSVLAEVPSDYRSAEAVSVCRGAPCQAPGLPRCRPGSSHTLSVPALRGAISLGQVHRGTLVGWRGQVPGDAKDLRPPVSCKPHHH